MTNRKNEPRFNAGESLSAAKLNRLSSLVAGILQRRQGFGTTKPRNLWVQLNADLDGATPLSTSTTAEATVWRKDVDGDYEATTQTETVVNRDTPSYSEDDYIRIKWQDGEWQPDGGGGGGGAPILIGNTVEADCTAGTVGISTEAPAWFTGGCDDIPDEAYGVVTVEDPLGVMGPLTETELTSTDPQSISVAVYTYPVDDCQNGVWVLLATTAISGC